MTVLLGAGRLAALSALGAANSANVQLAAIKTAAALKSQHRQSWKNLILSSHGGPAAKLQVYLEVRAASPDPHVKALSRALLFIYSSMENYFSFAVGQEL